MVAAVSDLVKVHLDPMPMLSYVIEGDGSSWPVTDMFDEDGVETTSINDACVIVAGKGGYWLTITLEVMETVQ